jgi:hypothetical protein
MALPVGNMAFAQRLGWDPFDGVTKLVEWFNKLNGQFDQFVASEQRGQLVRSIDGLRKNLYALEADTQVLLDRIPDKPPANRVKIQLRMFVSHLMNTVNALSRSVRDVGADLRLAEASQIEPSQIERRLTFGLRTREITLNFVEAQIEGQTPWDAAEVRDRLNEGLNAVRDAQLAATTFANS